MAWLISLLNNHFMNIANSLYTLMGTLCSDHEYDNYLVLSYALLLWLVVLSRFSSPHLKMCIVLQSFNMIKEFLTPELFVSDPCNLFIEGVADEAGLH